MLFRKRRKLAVDAQRGGGDGDGSPPPITEPLSYPVEFDMMMKGAIYKRASGPVRQFGVTVNGSTKLVTSGDEVNKDTYRALAEAGAIRPDPRYAKFVGLPSATVSEKSRSTTENDTSS